MSLLRICIIPKLNGLGGPASFQQRLIPLLEKHGCVVHHNLADKNTDVILVNGGTRNVFDLWLAKRHGVPIVHRLAQLNWVHRQHYSGMAFAFRSVRNNLLLAFIRRFLADAVIYQSGFVKSIWEERYGHVLAEANIIYNGVDTTVFNPAQYPMKVEQTPIQIAVVEGHLGEGNEVYLANAIHFGEAMAQAMGTKIMLRIAGDVPDALSKKWHRESALFRTQWEGILNRDEIIALQHSSHFMFSAELNGGCPNSVIEALACGTPVIGFATGALPELLNNGAGMAVPYGGNHWRLAPPDINGLVLAAQEILNNLPAYQQAARKKALDHYDIQSVSAQYLQVLLNQ